MGCGFYPVCMKIHEYQARDILKGAGVAIPASSVIDNIDAAGATYKAIAAESGQPVVVVKAQVHAGGRGKAGFVKLVRSAQEAEDAARFMLTNRMVSYQTGPEGLEVRKLLMAAGVDIHHEYYLAITTDRTTRRNVLIASAEGGVEIEKVAHEKPEAIIKAVLHPLLGLQAFQARGVAFDLGLTGKHVGQFASIATALAKVFIEKDCTIAEINPLVITKSGGRVGDLLALDAKFNFDDNATFRHKDVEAMFDPSEEDPLEMRAKKLGLSYIALDGSVGCLVNGAGLAMATMDIVKLHGEKHAKAGKPATTPANFLDVGGGASEDQVTGAFSILLSDPKVKGVLVNIFGGIMDCAVIAKGIVNAATNFENPDKSRGFKVPLVVRLEGTNVDAGRQLLKDAAGKLPTLQAATDLSDAAEKICRAVG